METFIYIYGMALLFVSTDGLQDMTKKLKEINRSAFPVAVRQALNSAAFDVKKNTLQQSAERNFIRRSPNFFKAFSGVKKAVGFNMNTMKSEVGMTDQGKSSARTAIRNMDKQEIGGEIEDGTDYLKASRGGNNNKRVSKANYFNKNKNLSGAFKNARTSKSQFIAKAYASFKGKKKMYFSSEKGQFLMQVTGIRKNKKGAIKIKSKLMTKSRSGKPAKIRATHFAREAAQATTLKIEGFYIAEAEKQINRVLRNNN